MDFRFLPNRPVRIQGIQRSRSARAPRVHSTDLCVAATAASAGGTRVNSNDDVKPEGPSFHETPQGHARSPQNRTTEMADQADQ